MLTLSVIDRSAEKRLDLTRQMRELIDSAYLRGDTLPQCQIDSTAPEQMTKHSVPDVICFPKDSASKDLALIREVRRVFPNSRLVAFISPENGRLEQLDMLSRLGVDDLVSADSSPLELFGRLILWSRSAIRSNNGKLIVVCGAKGGVGVTTVTALLAETSLALGSSAVMVDLDTRSQDLTRFYRVSPCVNEPLEGYLVGGYSPSGEVLGQIVVSLDAVSNGISIVPPPVSPEIHSQTMGISAKNLVRVIEMLDQQYDVVIIDLSTHSNMLREYLIRSADVVVFVTDNQVGSIPALVSGVTEVTTMSAPSSKALVFVNQIGRSGRVSFNFIRELLTKRTVFESLGMPIDRDVVPNLIDFRPDPEITRWTCSGDPIFDHVQHRNRRALVDALKTLGVGKIKNLDSERTSKLTTWQANLKRILSFEKPACSRSESIGWDGERIRPVIRQSV